MIIGAPSSSPITAHPTISPPSSATYVRDSSIPRRTAPSDHQRARPAWTYGSPRIGRYVDGQVACPTDRTASRSSRVAFRTLAATIFASGWRAPFTSVYVSNVNSGKLRIAPFDPIANPYTPGAGQKPAVLSGRDDELARFDATLSRLENGRAAQCPLVVGLRGVGKTVLLNEFARRSLARRWVVVEHELTANGDLFATATRLVREALLQVAPPSAWRAAGQRLGRLLRAVEVSYSIAGLTIASGDPGPGDEAVSCDRSRDMTDLLVALGEAAREHDRGVALLFDELQFAETEALGSLVTALHKVAQRDLPVTMVAAGLPQTRGVLAEAASYAERMFAPVEVGPLSGDDARRAVAEPAAADGVTFEPAALDDIVGFTEGYPFFLQTYGDHVWRHALNNPVRRSDTRAVAPVVRDSLDRGFFVFRTDRLPAAQRRYLRAMAEVGTGDVASGDVAAVLGMRSSAQAGQTRDALIRKGLIFSPRLGYAAFTVPQFGDYLRRHFELEQHQPRSRAR